jgi:hypothetical protein
MEVDDEFAAARDEAATAAKSSSEATKAIGKESRRP